MLTFFQQNAENLSFLDNIYDKYLISFCLRNVTDIDQSFKEALEFLNQGDNIIVLNLVDQIHLF